MRKLLPVSAALRAGVTSAGMRDGCSFLLTRRCRRPRLIASGRLADGDASAGQGALFSEENGAHPSAQATTSPSRAGLT